MLKVISKSTINEGILIDGSKKSKQECFEHWGIPIDSWQIHQTESSTDKKKILCPECLKNGNEIFLVQLAGCPTCPNCGWSACA